jgi:transcriptional regulator with XRE-family HTH domain
MRHNRVIRRYKAVQRPSGNRIRLWALVRLFRLSPSAVAKATGVSRSYVARLLSRKDDFTGSPEFFRTLEFKLGQIINGRASQFFTIPAVSVTRARDVLEMAA